MLLFLNKKDIIYCLLQCKNVFVKYQTGFNKKLEECRIISYSLSNTKSNNSLGWISKPLDNSAKVVI